MSVDLEVALIQSVRRSGAPGAVAYVGTPREIIYHGAIGYRQYGEVPSAAQRGTPYDVASLTKVVATTTAVMLLRDQGELSLDQQVSHYLPHPAFRGVTLRHLMHHTGGLLAFSPWYREVGSANEMLQRVADGGLDYAPGTRRVYSDIGYIMLGRIVELVARDSLDAFCARHIFAPLGMTHTAFKPPLAWQALCAATEQCPWRGRLLVGEVHDENAAALGGVAGHAGLFSTTDDLAKFARGMLDGRVLSPQTLDEVTRPGQVPFYPWQGLGWKMDPWSSGAEGFLPSRTAFGHTGWTGTCIWVDRGSGLFSILLSNTPHPVREQRDNRTLRTTFFTALADQQYPARRNVHTGLDRLLWDGFSAIRGRRVAVLTHHAAVDHLGRHILDVLGLFPELQLKRLYSPEHGIRGQAEAGEQVRGQAGPVPVVSLYGERKQPTPAELREIDLFVVDLQDVGARYYTYAATMKACMEACAAAGVRVLVLDRPNPVGGAVLEGPIAERYDSFVCWAPVPVRHGMTLGEIALFFQQTALRNQRVQLDVLRLDAWKPELLFDQCDLPWLPPSPNIPTPNTALLYTGTCLFEGTNLNEGRGTRTPFEIVGAPWLNAERVLRRLDPRDHPGCRLEAREYTPEAIPGMATNPRFLNERCQGIAIHVEDPHAVRGFRLTLALLRGIHEEHEAELRLPDFLDTLAGGPWLRRAVLGRAPVAELVASLQPALDAFDAQRPKLYAEGEA